MRHVGGDHPEADGLVTLPYSIFILFLLLIKAQVPDAQIPPLQTCARGGQPEKLILRKEGKLMLKEAKILTCIWMRYVDLPSRKIKLMVQRNPVEKEFRGRDHGRTIRSNCVDGYERTAGFQLPKPFRYFLPERLKIIMHI